MPQASAVAISSGLRCKRQLSNYRKKVRHKPPWHNTWGYCPAGYSPHHYQYSANDISPEVRRRLVSRITPIITNWLINRVPLECDAECPSGNKDCIFSSLWGYILILKAV